MTEIKLISDDLIEQTNAASSNALQEDYDALGLKLSRSNIDIDQITSRVMEFGVALPSWGTSRGGTRFAKFTLDGEPTNIHEKIEDCAVIHQLCCSTPRVSPHFPWDNVKDYVALRESAAAFGLSFDSINSNTFQDQKEQRNSYRTGSLASTESMTRTQAIEHNLECIELGKQLGSKALTIWVGDGSNLPGQQDLARSYDRYLGSVADIYKSAPSDWTLLLEHKLFEPAFYSSVLPDWGSSILAAQEVGERCKCLVDLGHHAPNVNIEQIVARLERFSKLGGFHFNDSKYGDDDLDSGSIAPHQLFLVFNELIEAEARSGEDFSPFYMIDQSHNVTDPIESLMVSADAIGTAYAKALLVNRQELHAAQESNDAMIAFLALRKAYNVDVSPILAKARKRNGGAIDPVNTYRLSNYRQDKAKVRSKPNEGAGII